MEKSRTRRMHAIISRLHQTQSFRLISVSEQESPERRKKTVISYASVPQGQFDTNNNKHDSTETYKDVNSKYPFCSPEPIYHLCQGGDSDTLILEKAIWNRKHEHRIMLVKK